MGSDGNTKKKVTTGGDKKEKERRQEGGYTGGSSKYDPHTGSNNLFKKLGLQEKRDEPTASKNDEDEIDFPEEPEQKKPQPAPIQTAPVKAAPPKFLPPPPSKSGASVSTGVTAKLSAPPKKQDDGTFILIQDYLI